MDRVEIGAHNLKFNGLKRWDETDVPLYDVMVDDPACPSRMEVRIKASKTDPFRQGISIFIWQSVI